MSALREILLWTADFVGLGLPERRQRRCRWQKPERYWTLREVERRRIRSRLERWRLQPGSIRFRRIEAGIRQCAPRVWANLTWESNAEDWQ